MVHILEEFPSLRLTFNLVPSLLAGLEQYLRRSQRRLRRSFPQAGRGAGARTRSSSWFAISFPSSTKTISSPTGATNSLYQKKMKHLAQQADPDWRRVFTHRRAARPAGLVPADLFRRILQSRRPPRRRPAAPRAEFFRKRQGDGQRRGKRDPGTRDPGIPEIPGQRARSSCAPARSTIRSCRCCSTRRPGERPTRAWPRTTSISTGKRTPGPSCSAGLDLMEKTFGEQAARHLAPGRRPFRSDAAPAGQSRHRLDRFRRGGPEPLAAAPPGARRRLHGSPTPARSTPPIPWPAAAENILPRPPALRPDRLLLPEVSRPRRGRRPAPPHQGHRGRPAPKG